MAHGMKLWLTATLTGAAIVAAWRLPLAPFPAPEARTRPAEMIRAAALNEEFRVTAEALRRVQWSDSLAPLSLAMARDGVAFLYPDVGLNADQVTRLERLIRDEVEAVRASDMVFGYVLQSSEQNREADMGISARDRTELFVGSLENRDYCLQVRVHKPDDVARTLATTLSGQSHVRPTAGVAGMCRPFLRYGMPGPEIGAWLAEGGIALAGEYGESEVPLPLLAGRRSLLGFSGFSPATRTPSGDRCLAGYAEACEALVMTPAEVNPSLARDLRVVRTSPVMSIGTWGAGSQVLHDEEYMFHDLEQEFGADAFRAFWTSDQDVRTAFQRSFGVPLGDWVVSWVDRTIGVDEPGPALSRTDSSGTALVIALLTGLAFLRIRRRSPI